MHITNSIILEIIDEYDVIATNEQGETVED
jgi:hypothetical protein